MITVSGHALHRVTIGSGNPVVMAHCALSRHDALLPLAEAIGGAATLIDMPGHGRSADWDGHTDYHKLVTDSLAACCDEPAHVIGHSFGATAALRLAVEQPDRVHRLTLIEPVYFAAAKSTPAHAAHQRDFAPFVAAMEADDRATAAEVFNGLWGAMPWADMPAALRHQIVKRIHLIPAGAVAIEDDPDGITSADRLSTLNIPVTLIRGRKSPPVMAAIHAALAARLPQARDHVVEDAAHMLPITHRAQVAAVIRAADPETR